MEALEERALLSAFTPIQIRHAYGFDRVGFENATQSLVAGDGQGTTIAIVDAYDDPNVAGDLTQFDNTYGLTAPPSFTKVNQTGGTIFPQADRGWSGEIALDVEYVHAMAPGANILLVEANDSSMNNLLTAVTYAARQPGVVAVSMSWGGNESSTETLDDSRFVTPSGHTGVTFLSASGDSGGVTSYPPSSPNVVAVGGTSLFLNSQGEYQSESGWSGSGGGISPYESQPAYQSGMVSQSTTRRTMPDLAFDANPNTGVMVYDTYGGRGLYAVGGTSASTPIMAGLVAIIDEGRADLFGKSSYTSTDFLNALYHLPQSDLNDIVSGNNGFPAGPGYDLVTGRGTPIVDRFVSAMTGAPVYNPLTGTLLVTGGGRGSDDTITLSQSDGQLVIEISASTPVAGSSIPANQTFTFDSSQVRSLTIDSGDGTTSLTIDDSADSGDRNVLLTASSLTGLSMGPINFGGSIHVLTITGGNGNNTYTITGTSATQGTSLQTGSGVDTINIESSSSPLTIDSASGSGADTLMVGDSSNRLSGITAAITVNAAATDTLVVNDGGDKGSRSFTLTDSSIAWGSATLNYTGLGAV
ncbi:MAG TPA: S53 family peptidase, partial [Gemmataceae bacterium]|nr:S53 family peptidase [Gemmataceae bacterium]